MREPTLHKARHLNRALVNELRKKGLIQTPPVEQAFRAVLRHCFLPGTPIEKVYADSVIPTKQDASGQWISSSSQPAIMAIMLEQLGLQPGHNVLEIGTGTGYNAALMAHIVGEGGQVVTLDIDEDLVEAATQNLKSAGFGRVQAICADGGYGWPDTAPYDRIILTVSAHDITPAWWDQLKREGRLVLPLVLRGSMKSVAFEPHGDHLVSLSVHDCGFISLRGDFAAAPSTRVVLGPDPSLYLELMDELPIDRELVYELLQSPGVDQTANIEATAWDVLYGNLWTWLALHESRLGKLVAEGDLVERNIVPAVLGVEAKQRSAGTVISWEPPALAALTRPPGERIALVPVEKLFEPDSPAGKPFALHVRQYGPDGSAAERLLGHIQAWIAAGRPSSDTMRLRAYRRESLDQPAAGAFVLEKPWTRLTVEWTGTGPG